MLLNIFYIIDLVINAALSAAFFYRFKQTKVNYYKIFGFATLGFLLGDIVLEISYIMFESVFVALLILSVGFIIGILSGLVILLTLLHMLQTWCGSMRRAAVPAAVKLDRVDQLVRILKIVYPALSGLFCICYIVIMLGLPAIGAILIMLIALVDWVAVVSQIAVSVWVFLDVYRVQAGDPVMEKRDQFIKIIGMTFFAAWPAMFSGLSVGYGASVCWWVFYAIALWKQNLVGFEREPEVKYATQGAQSEYVMKPNPAYNTNMV